jgi:hypothetical protein
MRWALLSLVLGAAAGLACAGAARPEGGPDGSTVALDAEADAAVPSDAAPGDAAAGDGGPADAGAVGADASFGVHALFDGATASFEGCLFGSPIAVPSNTGPKVVVASSRGEIAQIDPADGSELWRLRLADALPSAAEPYLLATPAASRGRLWVAYQRVDQTGARASHRVLAVELATGAIDAAYGELELSASVPGAGGQAVVFSPSTQASRAALVLARSGTSTEADRLFVSFGNIQDLQPWHGWVFEIDLGRWKAAGPASAVSGALVTTPETACGPNGASGARDHVCGGGVWSLAGPLVLPAATSTGGDEILIATGNGQNDVTRGDFANSVLRARAGGLAFVPGCDPGACAVGTPLDPDPACLASCRDVFVPRLLPGAPPLSPASGACQGKTFFECYAVLDWDLGANSPAFVAAASAIAMPGKDGALYLVDRAHLGTLLDRREIAAPCGTASDPCDADWAGMIVTQPAVAEVGGAPLVITPTFERDRTHPAGVVALEVGVDRRWTPRWQAPPADAPEALAQFRSSPSAVALASIDGEPYAFVIDVGGDKGGRGRLYGIRVQDGAIRIRAAVAGRGQRFQRPLVLGDALYFSSCSDDSGPSTLEAWSWAP